MQQKPKLTLKNAKEIQSARRYPYALTAPIAASMAAHSDERRVLQGSLSLGQKIKQAAEILNECRRNFIAAALEFEKADTLDSRRAIAETEWRFICARHQYYEARAAWNLEQTQPVSFPPPMDKGK